MKEYRQRIYLTIPRSDLKRYRESGFDNSGISGTFHIRILFYVLMLFINVGYLHAQVKVWNVDDCIQYALQKNIQVQQAEVSSDINGINLNFTKSAWYPSLNGSANQNFSWRYQSGNLTGSNVFAGSNGTSFSLNSGITLFNGKRIRNAVMQSGTNYEASIYNIEVIKETVSLNVLNAYLQVLYAEEQVKNANDQIASLNEQLNLAAERLKLGAIANSDYLQVKSQLATEKQTVAAAQNQLAINKITLKQLMELPETPDFVIESPNLDSLINQKLLPDPKEVFRVAVGIKPEVKNAELARQSSQISIDLAKAGYFPNFSMNAGISTLYSSNSATASSFGYQLRNNFTPVIGLNASVPIYLNRQVRTNVAIARKNTGNAELNEYNVKNQLRKSIEQACQDVISSQIEYEASIEAYKAVKESFDVASEKYFQGIMNSVDFLIQKTTYISVESTLLQSKYKLIFSYKVLDFYTGMPLSFKSSR
jgi:outer membrane protein